MQDEPHVNDLPWAAGFFDGEGSVCCTTNNGVAFSRVQLSIGQKDFNGGIADTLLRFQKAVGCGHIYVKTKGEKESNQHQFIISKNQDVRKVIDLLWNELSEAKKQQATRAFQLLRKNHARV